MTQTGIPQYIANYVQELRDLLQFLAGSQITVNGVATNQTTLLYTVTAGKTLILEHYNVGIDWSAVGNGQLIITNAADATQYTLVSFTAPVATGQFPIIGNLLLMIPAGWKIKLVSSAANFNVRGFFKGIEV